MIALFLMHAALAAPVSVRVCAQYNLQLTDADPAVGDDFLNASGIAKATGVRLRVLNATTGAVSFDDWTEDSGANEGCTASPLSLDTASTYIVKMESRARIGTNTVKVITTGINSYGPWAKTFSLSSLTYTLTAPVSPIWNILGVASVALGRHDGGLSDQTYTFQYDTDSPSNLYDPVIDRVVIEEQGYGLKYVIAHEMGHMVSARVGGVANNDPSLNEPPCWIASSTLGAHAWQSKEYQPTAYWEGLAHFYAASAFNIESGGACWFKYYKPTDWNHSGGISVDPSDLELDNSIVSCASGPTYQPSENHLSNFCSGGTTQNVAMEFDWLRFFWDTASTYGIEVEDHLDVYDTADGPSWDRTTLTCGWVMGDWICPNQASLRLQNAANTLGYGAFWSSMSTIHGVNR